MNNPGAIVIFARTPQISRVSRDEPFAALPWEDLDAIFHACAGDLLQQAVAVPDSDVLVYRTRGEFPDEVLLPFGESVKAFDMPRGDLGTVVQHAVDGAFHEMYHRVLVVIDNNPLLTTEFFRRAFEQLEADDDCMVVCPTDDDRVSMVALKAAPPSLFTDRAGQALQKPSSLMSRLCELDAFMFVTPPVYMLDTPSRLDRLRGDIERLDATEPVYPKRTAAVYRTLEKKYRLRKATK